MTQTQTTTSAVEIAKLEATISERRAAGKSTAASERRLARLIAESTPATPNRLDEIARRDGWAGAAEWLRAAGRLHCATADEAAFAATAAAEHEAKASYNDVWATDDDARLVVVG